MAQIVRQLARALLPRTSRAMSTLGLEIHEAYITPSHLQQEILVWSRMFKRLKDIPAQVNQIEMSKAYYVFRTEICFATYIAGCLTMIASSRDARQYRLQQSDPQTYVAEPVRGLPAFIDSDVGSPF